MVSGTPRHRGITLATTNCGEQTLPERKKGTGDERGGSPLPEGVSGLSGIEQSGAFGDGLRVFPHLGRESHVPYALHGVFGKAQYTCHDSTPRYVCAPWRYSDSIQETDDELDLKVAQKEGRFDGGGGGWDGTFIFARRSPDLLAALRCQLKSGR